MSAPVTTALLGDEAPPPFAWRHDEVAALEEARRRSLPALLFFHAAWSASSIVLERELWDEPSVRNAAVGVVAVEVDLTDTGPDNEQRAARHAIDHVPTVLVVGSDGRIRARFEGDVTAAALVEALEAAR